MNHKGSCLVYLIDKPQDLGFLNKDVRAKTQIKKGLA